MTQIDEPNQDTYREHSVGSHSDDRGGDSDLPCYCDRRINQDTTPIDELYEKVEACFDLRISSSGASITIKLGGEQMTVDYEAFLELRKKIEALISDQVREARIDELKNIMSHLVIYHGDKPARAVSTAKIRGRIAQLEQLTTNLLKIRSNT